MGAYVSCELRSIRGHTVYYGLAGAMRAVYRRDLLISRILLAISALGIVGAGLLREPALVAFFAVAAILTKLGFWHRHLRPK